MKISVAKAHEKSQRTQFFDVLEATGRELCAAMCRYQWSPIVWDDGRRLQEKFLFSTACVLDFDDGKWALADAENFVRSFHFRAIIGTTKSHQIEKNGAVCDRFRIVIPWTKPCDNVWAHRQNMEKIFSSMPVDKACKDGARSYRPFTAIHAVFDGKTLNWDKFKERKQEPVYYIRGSVPKWILEVLTNGAPDGQRNGACFRVAANLVKCGLRDEEIETMIVSSNIGLTEREKRDAARSGIRAGRQRCG